MYGRLKGMCLYILNNVRKRMTKCVENSTDKIIVETTNSMPKNKKTYYGGVMRKSRKR